MNPYDDLMAWLDDQRPAMVELPAKIVNTDCGSYDHANVREIGLIIKAHLEARDLAANRKLFQLYAEASSEFGRQADGEFRGGAADSGFTSALGVPTICA